MHAGHRRPAADARVALRRAVRRFLGGADLLRIGGGARARDRGAVRRRRRRALGRLRASSRRAMGSDGCAAGWAVQAARIAGRLGAAAAAVGEGRAIAAPPRADARRRLRPQARLSFIRGRRRGRRSMPPTSPSEVRDADPFAGFRAAYARLHRRLTPLDRSLYVDVNTYLIDDIMTKVDRMSMAVSLEAREPLLDHKLLEFAATVPDALQAAERPEQVPAAAAARAQRPEVDRRSPEARIRGADRRLAAHGRSRRWPTTCSSTAGCAIAASSTTGDRRAASGSEHQRRAPRPSPSAVEPA